MVFEEVFVTETDGMGTGFFRVLLLLAAPPLFVIQSVKEVMDVQVLTGSGIKTSTSTLRLSRTRTRTTGHIGVQCVYGRTDACAVGASGRVGMVVRVHRQVRKGYVQMQEALPRHAHAHAHAHTNTGMRIGMDIESESSRHGESYKHEHAHMARHRQVTEQSEKRGGVCNLVLSQ
jgi:hypothetical protein